MYVYIYIYIYIYTHKQICAVYKVFNDNLFYDCLWSTATFVSRVHLSRALLSSILFICCASPDKEFIEQLAIGTGEIELSNT